MRSRSFFKVASAVLAFAMLGGCLVSETPLLDASNGNARPFNDGTYIGCSNSDDPEEDDCTTFTVKRLANGALSFINEDEPEDPGEMRFRRIARGGYVVQASDDDSYIYYYGAGDPSRFVLTLMECSKLPAALREGLINSGALEIDGDSFDVCAVKNLKGLTSAAKAYHRGQVSNEDEASIEFKPVPAE